MISSLGSRLKSAEGKGKKRPVIMNSGILRPSTSPEIGGRKRIAGLETAALQAGLEPAHALRRTAVRERIRHDDAARLTLQPVVADRARGVQALLDIALLQNLAHTVGAIGPDAGDAVRLQFDPDRDRVRSPFVAALALGVRGLQNAKLVLHVVADFVSDHVGLGKIPRRV